MPYYHELRPMAFRLTPAASALGASLQGLLLPQAWRDLWQLLGTSSRRSRDAGSAHPIVRTRSLHAALRVLMPDVTSTGKQILAAHAGMPWLYTLSPTPPSAHTIARVVRAWMMSPAFRNAPEIDRLTLAQHLLANGVEWTSLTHLPLTHWTPNIQNGTAEPPAVASSLVYRVLPDVLAARLCAPGVQFVYGAQRVQLRRAPLTSDDANGAELISWPPFRYEDARGRAWYYSFVVTLTVQTVPFQAEPVIYTDLSLRRWVSRPIGGWVSHDVSTYILAPFSWLPQTATPTNFQVARVHWRRGKDSFQVDWHSDLIAILAELGQSAPQLQRYPSAAALVANPEDFVRPAFIPHSTDPAIVLALSTRLQEQQRHPVRPGYMPPDRHHLLAEQVAARLAPELELIAPYSRERFTIPPAARIATRAAAEATPADDEAYAESIGASQDVPASAAEKSSEWHEWRAAIARCFAHQPLAFHLYTQTETIRAALRLALAELLGPAATLGDAAAGTPVRWTLGTARVEVYEHVLGADGDRLSLGGTGRPHERRQRALDERAETFAQRVRAEGGTGFPKTPCAALIEISPPETYRTSRDSDPYHALRLGCSRAGWIAQFITTETAHANRDNDPAQAEGDREQSSLPHRAASAVRDLLRQLGVLRALLPRRFTYREGRTARDVSLPRSLDCVGVWLIRQTRWGAAARQAQYVPVLVRLCAETLEVEATALGFPRDRDRGIWRPYPEALTQLACQLSSGAGAASIADVRKVMPALGPLLRQAVFESGRDTLLLVHAQNLRSAWQWLTNGNLTTTGVRLVNGRSTSIPLARFPGLRIVRVRDASGHETPEWYGNGPEHGLPAGLWRLGGRVYGSTSGKGKNKTTLSTLLSKADPWTTIKRDGHGTVVEHEPQPRTHAWNPQLIELTCASLQEGDEPWFWAAIAHQLRTAASHWDDTLTLPLPLHLARLMQEYAFSMSGEEDEQKDEEDLDGVHEEEEEVNDGGIRSTLVLDQSN